MKTTLEQWRMFKAVVDHGGYAQASEAIHKSQSTISYGVHKLQEQLGVKLLEVEGRKALLTEHGRIMLNRAENLLTQAENIDKVASSLNQGVEPTVRLALDMIYPYPALFQVLEQFSQRFPSTRVELEEHVLNGGIDMLEEGLVDLLITPRVPQGWTGQHVYRARFLPVCAPDHPLLHPTHSLTYQDLAQYRQVVLRDSSKKQRTDSGWLGAHQRWTVSHTSTSLEIVHHGLGYAWFPEHWVSADLAQGRLKIIPLEPDGTRYADLYLVEAHGEASGPACKALAQLLAHPLDCSTPNASCEY